MSTRLYTGRYTWGQWTDEYEEYMYRLYHAMTACIENDRVPLLDQLEFSDFVAFCKRYTHAPVANQSHRGGGGGGREVSRSTIEATNAA